MAKFHSLKVSDIRQETADCVSVAFKVPENLRADFEFQAGQYLTLRTDINEEDIRRSYSICSSPLENELRVAIKKVEGGRFSTYANEKLQIGDSLQVMTPMGKFTTPIDTKNEKRYVAFAAGSGITPIMSIMKSVLQTEPKSHFTLYYSNRNFDSIIFREAIIELKNVYFEQLSVQHILSREHQGSPLFYGRIDKEKCSSICNLLLDLSTVDEFFICGPEEMIFAVKDTLTEEGVDKNKIHFELFTSPLGKINQVKKTVSRPALDSKITIQLDGNTFDIALNSDGENILDTALKNGADLPFACKGGVCATCKAKIEKGKVITPFGKDYLK